MKTSKINSTYVAYKLNDVFVSCNEFHANDNTMVNVIAKQLITNELQFAENEANTVSPVYIDYILIYIGYIIIITNNNWHCK